MDRVAVLIIDMLKDFVYGSLKCDKAKTIIPNIKKLLKTARKHGVPIIYANDAHLPEIDLEFKKWGPHAIKGTEGAEVIDELKPQKSDFIIEKRRYSAFYETGLDMLLRELQVDTLILTGLATEICVKHTAADAFYRGYKIIVPKDCVATFKDEDHEWGLKYMERIYGAEITTSDEIIRKWSEEQN